MKLRIRELLKRVQGLVGVHKSQDSHWSGPTWELTLSITSEDSLAGMGVCVCLCVCVCVLRRGVENMLLGSFGVYEQQLWSQSS